MKNEITAREAGTVKNRYMKRLGMHALWLGIPPLLVAIALLIWTQSELFPHFLVLWAGCMAGVWLSFGARKSVLKFEELHIPEKDRLEPGIRLVFAGLLTVIIGLLFSTKAVVINLGSVSTDAFTKDWTLALLIGMLCGFSEKALSSKVTKQASKLLEFGE